MKAFQNCYMNRPSVTVNKILYTLAEHKCYVQNNETSKLQVHSTHPHKLIGQAKSQENAGQITSMILL